jgi:hypothetical protein
MLYKIAYSVSNGYRCCCFSSWEVDDIFVDTLEEALKYCPIQLKDKDPLPFNSNCEVTEVEVFDLKSGSRIAGASLTWPGVSQVYSLWAGYRADTGAFQTVYKDRKVVSILWSEVLEETKRG